MPWEITLLRHLVLVVLLALVAPATADEQQCPQDMDLVRGSAASKESARGTSSKVQQFCLGRTEVTAAQYERCVGTGSCAPAVAPTANATAADLVLNKSCIGDAAVPGARASCVDWAQGRAFCKVHGRRLPTLEERLAAHLADGAFRCALDGKVASKAPRRAANPKEAAAASACSSRAELIFVKRCRQACQIESKGKNPVRTEECLMRCGKQPEMALFLGDCMKRAGYASRAPPEKP